MGLTEATPVFNTVDGYSRPMSEWLLLFPSLTRGLSSVLQCQKTSENLNSALEGILRLVCGPIFHFMF